MYSKHRNTTGGLRGNGLSLEPPSAPDYSDMISRHVSALGFIKLRELSRDYREHGCKWGVVPFGGFRAWLAETIDRRIDEEAAKSWEDAREWSE